VGTQTERPPADQGLSSLGLIMSLTGSVMAPLMGAMLLGQIKDAADRAEALSRHGGDSDSKTLWLFFILIASVVRSLVHRMAGNRLWRDTPSDPPAMSGITAYTAAAAAHTGVWLLYLKIKVQAPLAVLLGATVLLMAWPLAILVVTRARRFASLGPRVPVAEDNGFEGLAVLMAILGFAGLMCSIVVVVLGFSARDEDTSMANVLLTCGAALVVRSIIHVSVGARAVRGTAVNSVADFLRYGNVGMAIGAAVGGVLTLWLFLSAKVDFFALVMGLAVLLSLLAWPAIVRRFVQWRHLADMGNDSVRRRSPDAGITALGWLLLAGAAATLGSYIAATLWEDSLGRRGAGMMMQMAGTPFNQTQEWWALPLGLGELWAALEILAVSPRRRIVASAWGLVALVYTSIELGPHLKPALDAAMAERALTFAAFFLAITPAVATLLLVNRTPLPPDVAKTVKVFE
jgi:hypothetical protein